ncbi:MAG: diguanylate cyclase domain-containing protein [Massilia sp.]
MDESTQLALGTPSATKSRRLIVIAWLFTGIIVLAMLVTYYGISVLAAERAYVGGEGLWSKAQKEMVYALARYARYHKSADYQSFEAALAINLGDRQARLELEKPNPDYALARAGFLQGRNHPDDIEGMMRLFRDFRQVREMDQAIALWARADGQIDELVALAGRIHQAVEAGNTDESVMLPHLRALFAIHQRLIPLEDDFSATLGQAARKTQFLLLIVLFAGVSMFLGVAFLFSQRMVWQSAKLEDALRQGESQLRGLLQFAPLPILIVRMADQRFLFANEHALKQFKVAPADMDSWRARDVYVSLDDRDRLMAHLTQHRSADDWEIRLQDLDGIRFWAAISCQCISYNGEDCVLTALSNIEVRKRTQQELQHRAFHDELTGLPNRAMFMGSLRAAFEAKAGKGGHFALMFVDIDRFKVINDKLGHAAGDLLLQEVATRLGTSVSATDTVARLGGDEFVILVVERADPTWLTTRAKSIMAAMEEAIVLDAHRIHITVSIGISLYPQHGADLMTLMRSADMAMYRAKEQGRNNFQWCSEEDC